MTSWQLQTAKARFSELIRTVKSRGPQSISLHGRQEAVVISMRDYRRLKKGGSNLADFLKNSPFHGLDLGLERNRTASRRVEL